MPKGVTGKKTLSLVLLAVAFIPALWALWEAKEFLASQFAANHSPGSNTFKNFERGLEIGYWRWRMGSLLSGSLLLFVPGWLILKAGEGRNISRADLIGVKDSSGRRPGLLVVIAFLTLWTATLVVMYLAYSWREPEGPIAGAWQETILLPDRVADTVTSQILSLG